MKAAAAKTAKRAAKGAAKAHTRDSLQALSKLAEFVDGKYRIVSQPPVVIPLRELAPKLGRSLDDMQNVIQDQFRSYRSTLQEDRRWLLERYEIVDMARKVVGVGSVGARAWILLLVGRDNDDPLFLQFKEAQASVLEPFLGRSRFAQHGQRVVEGQRMMQAAPDILLGWERVVAIDGEKRDFYIRQLWDAKGSAEVELMDETALAAYGRICGWTLARAHARSGDRIAISAYLGSSSSFDRAMAAFAESYADQNERDYRALQEAAASGRVSAEIGV